MRKSLCNNRCVKTYNENYTKYRAILELEHHVFTFEVPQMRCLSIELAYSTQYRFSSKQVSSKGLRLWKFTNFHDFFQIIFQIIRYTCV